MKGTGDRGPGGGDKVEGFIIIIIIIIKKQKKNHFFDLSSPTL